jgi:hypothetical protein
MTAEWVEEYFKLLSSPDPRDLDIQGAQLLKRAHTPASLFRYRPFPPEDDAAAPGNNKAVRLRKRTLDEVRTGAVHLCSPDSFNDPYDSAFCILNQNLLDPVDRGELLELLSSQGATELLSEGEVKLILDSPTPLRTLGRLVLRQDLTLPEDKVDAFVDRVCERATQRMQRTTEDMGFHMREGVRVCCFSTTVKSIVMWSHYASAHRGVCIEYDLSALPADSWLRYGICPVVYSEKLFDAGEYFRRAREGDANNMWLTLACLQKSLEWSYENEWRLVVPLGPGQPRGQTISMPIKALYLGSGIPSSTEDEVLAAAARQGLPVLKMRLVENAFQLQAEPISRRTRFMHVAGQHKERS